MKNRSLAGYAALLSFTMAAIAMCFGFFSATWVVSDRRLPGSSLDRFGLWTHCFRSLAHPANAANAEQVFFVGCHWIFDPFTKGYSTIRSFLLPPFIILTQVFYTFAFLGTLMSTVGSLFYIQFCVPDKKRVIKLTFALGIMLIFSGFCAAVSVIVFSMYALEPEWMPGYQNNYFGWAFMAAITSSVFLVVSGICYLLETNIQMKKRRTFSRSQTNFFDEVDK